jgi:hypothetical protein
MVSSVRVVTQCEVPEASRCCPARYDPTLLAVIPREVLERDYGCGNPTEHLRPGEAVYGLPMSTTNVPLGGIFQGHRTVMERS